MPISYPLADNEGNTPLLKLVQPRNVFEATNILVRLQEQINLGTLITETVQTVTPKPVLIVTLNDKQIFFEEHYALGNGDCGFIVLGTDRTELSDKLLQFKDSEDYRKKLAPEIYNAFFEGSIKGIPEIDNAFITLNKEMTDLDKTYSKINSQVNCPPVEDGFKTQAQQLLEYLKANLEKVSGKTTYKKLAEELEKSMREIEQVNQSLHALCSSPKVYEYYLKAYKTTGLWLGYESAKLFAEIMKRNLFIFERIPNTNNLILRDCYCSNHQDVTYMLHTNGYTHFNMLAEIAPNAVTENIVRSNTIFRISKDYLTEKNKYGHNLLHRAVRCPWADTLVPYLLTNLNFKQKINETDIYGKTALHRAIRYFVDQENNRHTSLMNELLGDINAFKKLCGTVFTALIAAGADLHKVDSSKQSSLDRAKQYNPLYQKFFGQEFFLNEWLLKKQLEYFPQSRSVSAPIPNGANTTPPRIQMMPPPAPPATNGSQNLPPSNKQTQLPTASLDKAPTKKSKRTNNITPSANDKSAKKSKRTPAAKGSVIPQATPLFNKPASTPTPITIDDDEMNIPMTPMMSPATPNVFTPLLPNTPSTPQNYSLSASFFASNPLNNTLPTTPATPGTPLTPIFDDYEADFNDGLNPR